MFVRALLSILLASQVAQPVTTKQGLDALPEDRVISELANRGLDDLLDHALAKSEIPPARRQGLRAMMALRQLADPGAKLTPRQRADSIDRIVKGIEQALPGLDDPAALIDQARTLLAAGVERDINILEYWGEDRATQQRVRPVIHAVMKLFDRAASLAQRDAEELGNK